MRRESAKVKYSDLDTLILITGHKDGKIVRWEGLVPSKILVRSTSAVVDIAVIKDFSVVATAEGIIELYSLDFQKKFRRLDIRNFAYKLISNSIKNIVVTGSSIYFNTYGGDFIKLKLVLGEAQESGASITFRVG
jgi:hypothetical protein